MPDWSLTGQSRCPFGASSASGQSSAMQDRSFCVCKRSQPCHGVLVAEQRPGGLEIPSNYSQKLTCGTRHHFISPAPCSGFNQEKIRDLQRGFNQVCTSQASPMLSHKQWHTGCGECHDMVATSMSSTFCTLMLKLGSPFYIQSRSNAQASSQTCYAANACSANGNCHLANLPADEAMRGSTKEARGKAGATEGVSQHDETASLQGSAEGSAFGSSFQGHPSQHEADADSLTSHLGPALGYNPSPTRLPGFADISVQLYVLSIDVQL